MQLKQTFEGLGGALKEQQDQLKQMNPTSKIKKENNEKVNINKKYFEQFFEVTKQQLEDLFEIAEMNLEFSKSKQNAYSEQIMIDIKKHYS